MTEEEWLAASDPMQMLEFIWAQRSRAYGVYDLAKQPVRKLNLFKIACCRAVWLYLSIPCKEAVSVFERFVEGLANENEFSTSVLLQPSWEGVRDNAIIRGLAYKNGYIYLADDLAAALAVSAGCAEAGLHSPNEKRLIRQVALLQDIFGNPFRKVTVEPAWLTSTVISLATGIYKSRDFNSIPILADALQDAGCDNDDVLSHCRGPGPHVCGCWVVDWVLGKG